MKSKVEDVILFDYMAVSVFMLVSHCGIPALHSMVKREYEVGNILHPNASTLFYECLFVSFK